MSLLREAEPASGLGTLCGPFGYSRQTYYKRDDEGFKPLALEPMIVERVKSYRNDNPRLGSVKLWLMLKRQLEDTGCSGCQAKQDSCIQKQVKGSRGVNQNRDGVNQIRDLNETM